MRWQMTLPSSEAQHNRNSSVQCCVHLRHFKRQQRDAFLLALLKRHTTHKQTTWCISTCQIKSQHIAITCSLHFWCVLYRCCEGREGLHHFLLFCILLERQQLLLPRYPLALVHDLHSYAHNTYPKPPNTRLSSLKQTPLLLLFLVAKVS